ncbi:MAG: hypothetical protein ACTHKB_00785 [Burkholderiaceae bacterium]
MAGQAFGCRPLRAKREILLRDGPDAMPPSWRKTWLVQRIRATPPWADFAAIRKTYKLADDLTEATGVKHVVDHVVPLNHPRVCGLHVDHNLQILTERANAAKSNYFCPEQDDLFSEPEQLRLL